MYTREASKLSIDALEDTMVLQASYENLTGLYTQAPKFNRIFRVLIENSYVALQKRVLENISSTAEERYLSFLKTYPSLSNRLPQTQIAAYLGVTPEFVSRIRNSPAGARMAKALGTPGAASLESAAFQTPERAVLFYATDDNGINPEIEQLITDNGFAPVNVGGIDQSIRIEVVGDLHEFGALGKTVTTAEAKEKI